MFKTGYEDLTSHIEQSGAYLSFKYDKVQVGNI